jgi:hypothetical protein
VERDRWHPEPTEHAVDGCRSSGGDVVGTSNTPDPDVPVPPGGGAAERLREFLAAREEPTSEPPEDEAPDDGLVEEPDDGEDARGS